MAFDFESLYKRYPRKEGKTRGMLKLKQTIKTEAQYAAFVSALDNYIILCQKEKRTLEYIKHWATFVNNWSDYLDPRVIGDQQPTMLTQAERIIRGDL